jgi:nitrogen fixation/metabolism regulation signal transduction histidine kinase
MDNSENGGSKLHQLMQPLNIIRLSCGNIRVRIAKALDEENAEYLNAKLDRIEEQVTRLNQLLQDQKTEITD